MCGRYAITLPPEAMRNFFRYAEQPNFPPRYNIAPTQPVPVVKLDRDGARHFALVRWGFLPGFAKDAKTFPLIINARAETIGEKPSFRNALRRRRCLFMMDGYYEWRRQERGKQPFLFRRADGAPMGVAGLWETYCGADGSEIDTACLITTTANGAAAAVHDRMPAILEPEDFAAWLDLDELATPHAAALLRPAGDDVLEFFAIGAAIGKAANDGPELQRPLGVQRR